MPNKMLIDATHPEETRVVVVRGNRVEEFDFETAQRRQLRGNIYLAKVTRVEPSLQAAFIEYGGNRHGFLAFSEIHPDYYQIPMADRQALIEAEEQAHREAEEESETRSHRRRSRHRNARRRNHGDRVQSAVVETPNNDAAVAAAPAEFPGFTIFDMRDPAVIAAEAAAAVAAPADIVEATQVPDEAPAELSAIEATDIEADILPAEAADGFVAETEASIAPAQSADDSDHEDDEDEDEDDEESEEDIVESVGGDDALEEVPERAYRQRKQYKIQEVIKRRQVMLVQVVKEERGNKGAALTTYLSLAGRYAVLMPNTARGGGISRKITSAQDRSRLKEVVQDLDVPEGMGIILRTAGASRTKPEIKRDFEYLIRMWETVRDMTLRSQAPTLVYEEGSLIKRSLRDLYNKEIDEILVAGEAGYHEARDFMHMLMPSNTRAVKLYREGQPLFSRMGVESQLDAMFSPTVQLKSGGYIVINQTEALVSIDVNSGRSTREHHIEDTALKTNMEAAEEVARQLRLRDLAGLIVIDFIDMDEKRNNRAVERKLSDCLRQDRARIQVGRISHFGLLEMSRQRIRASVLESSTEVCPHCGGNGHVRSVSSVALQLLRGIEEALMKGATHNLVVRTRSDVALYVLNHKRGHLCDLEDGFKVNISIVADAHVHGNNAFIIDRAEQIHTPETAKAILAAQLASLPLIEDNYADDDFEDEIDLESDDAENGNGDEASADDSNGQDSDSPRRKRRRRRRSRSGESREASATDSDEDNGSVASDGEASEGDVTEAASDESDAEEEGGDLQADRNGAQNGERRPRRRGRRGGRRRRGAGEESNTETEDNGIEAAGDDETASISADVDERTADAADPASEAAAPRVIEIREWSSQETAEPEAVAESAPEAPPAAADETAPAAAAEPAPAVAEAVAETVETVEAPAPAEPANEPSSGKPARRRSTVREKVSFASETPAEPATSIANEEPSVVAEVAATESVTTAAPVTEQVAATPEAEPKPRRSGWWSRRFGSAE